MKAELVNSKQGRYTVIEVPSESNPNVVYRVDVTNQRCSCPAWKFSKGHTRMCKHLRSLGFTELLRPVKPEVVNGVQYL
jgi:hypothetical protein